MAAMSRDRPVCVVDAYSSGRYLPAAIRSRGYPCVHVQSDPVIPRPFLEGFPKKDFRACLVHQGDLEQTARELESLGVGSVIAGFEAGVELADALQDRMGLPGNGAATSRVRRDKFLMQKALEDAGVPAMAFHETGDLEELEHWVLGLGKWPVVLKPLSGAGTQGVHVCRNMDEIRRAFESLRACPDVFGKPNTAILAEEYLLGREVVVNTVSAHGRHAVAEVWDYRKEEMPGGSPVYDFVRLLDFPGDGMGGLLAYALAVLDALSIRLGPAHTEIKLTPHGPRLVETGARIMGGSIPPELITECIGWNQVDLSLNAYLDPERFLDLTVAPYHLKKHLLLKWMISYAEGPVASIPAEEIMRRLPSQRKTIFSVAPGSFMPRTVDMLTTPAHVLLCHEDEETLMEDYQVLHGLEMEAADCLFEPPAPEGQGGGLPGEARLVPEERVGEDAEIISRCLGLSVGQKLLDCPCGDGRLSLHLAREGANVTGVDPNARLVAQAGERFRKAGLEGGFAKMDMRFLPFQEDFDAVVVWNGAFGAFGGLDDLSAMESLGRAVKRDGLLLVEAPNCRGAIRDGRAGAPPGFHGYTEGEYRALMRAAGVTLEKVYGDGMSAPGPRSKRMVLLGRKA